MGTGNRSTLMVSPWEKWEDGMPRRITISASGQRSKMRSWMTSNGWELETWKDDNGQWWGRLLDTQTPEHRRTHDQYRNVVRLKQRIRAAKAAGTDPSVYEQQLEQQRREMYQ